MDEFRRHTKADKCWSDRQTELTTRYVGMDAEFDMASNIVSAATRADTE